MIFGKSVGFHGFLETVARNIVILRGIVLLISRFMLLIGNLQEDSSGKGSTLTAAFIDCLSTMTQL